LRTSLSRYWEGLNYGTYLAAHIVKPTHPAKMGWVGETQNAAEIFQAVDAECRKDMHQNIADVVQRLFDKMYSDSVNSVSN